jgi:flagellar hook-associated protein 2
MADSASSVTGLISGIDYRALVDAIIASEHQPADAAQTQIDLATSRKTAVQAYRGLLDTLRGAFDALRKGTGLDAVAATVNGTGVGGRSLLGATASSTAQQGTYEIEVVSLARAAKLGSTSVADPATALGYAGDFTLNGVTLSVTATDTLNDIRDRINATNTGLTPSRVSATILSVAPGDNRLILTSTVGGSAGIEHTDASGGVLASLGLTGGSEILVAGADAQIEIDGIPITRTTNDIADAIAGVTLSLQNAEPGTTVTVEVKRDAQAALDAAKTFVEAYNATVKFLKDQQTAGASPPPLYGDSTLRMSRALLSQGIVGMIVGDVAVPTTGSRAGFSISKTGELSVDESKFTAAYAADFDNLRALLTAGTGGATLDTALTSLLETNTGSLDVKTTGLDSQIFRLQDRIDRIEARLEQRRAALLSRFSQMEATIGALQSQSSFLSSQSALFASTPKSSSQ